MAVKMPRLTAMLLASLCLAAAMAAPALADEAPDAPANSIVQPSDGESSASSGIEGPIASAAAHCVGQAVQESGTTMLDLFTTLASLKAQILEAQAAEQRAFDAMPTGSLDINGTIVEYEESYTTPEAPLNGKGGLWLGSDSTTDDSWGYFIGHNPGPFTCVMDLKRGDTVRLRDRDDNARTYTVVKTMVVPDHTRWQEIAEDVTGFGESVILQTCVGDNATYRVVVAA